VPEAVVPEAVVPEAVVAEVVADAAPAPAAQIVTGDDQSALKSQVSALEQKLEAMDAKLNEAVEKIAVLPAAAPAVDDARLASIQKTLERLEARLDDVASAPRTASKKAEPKQEDAPYVVVTPDAPAPKKSVKAKPQVAANDMDAPYVPPVEKAAVKTPSNPWSLRGAQSGRAIIAKGDDMREVSVGETVAGLGKITGIATVGGRWVVQGTHGRVTQ
jgi:hypothetical protein